MDAVQLIRCRFSEAQSNPVLNIDFLKKNVPLNLV